MQSCALCWSTISSGACHKDFIRAGECSRRHYRLLEVHDITVITRGTTAGLSDSLWNWRFFSERYGRLVFLNCPDIFRTALLTGRKL